MSHGKQFTQQDAKNVIITAVEGGIGYWSQVENYYPGEGRVTILECEYETIDGLDIFHVISTHKITYKDVLNKKKEFQEYAQKNLPSIQPIDWEDIDAEVADCFIQFICFGEVIYG